jgi:drug/metabolite transporter (DMT)-like permease
MTIAIGDLGVANTTEMSVAPLDRGWTMFARTPARGSALHDVADETPVEQVWEALAVLHRNQIAHGDLRSKEITVDDGAVLFGGFGYVQCARLYTGKESALGAPMAPAHVISWVLVLALPLTLPLSALLVASSWPAQAIRPAAWLGFAYVSVISMWLGFFPWYRGLALGGTLRVSQVQLVQPFLSMWLAVPLLGESLDLPTVGFSLAVMATVIVSKRSAAPRG